MESSPLECDICRNFFSADHLPRILPCSHTFCGLCIDGIIAAQSKTCPNCREEFTAASAEDFTINRSLLLVAEQFEPMSVKPKTLSKGPTGYGKKFAKELLQEEETRVLGELEIIEEMKNAFVATETLKEMKDGVLDTKMEVERFKFMLRDIELSTEQILEKISTCEAKLEPATDPTLIKPNQDYHEMVEIIKAVLSKNQRERDNIMKDTFKMKRKLKNVAEEIEKETRVAVKVIEGKQMVAPVGVKPTKQVCWSHFEEGTLLPEGLSIKLKALMERSSRRVLLDLAVEGTRFGRLVIKVKDESNLALNFLHLCAGDLGPSYANSHLSRMEMKGQDGEHIWVNGYKTSGGYTTTAIIKPNWNIEGQREIYKRTPDGRASEFFIVTRDHPSGSNNNCFGIVEEGLDTLRDAILRYPNIGAVRIVNCGLLMFPL